MPDTPTTFWDHLDELRKVLFRCAIATVVAAVGAFCFKETLFGIVLAPKQPDFVFYRLLNKAGAWLSIPDLHTGDFHIQLINTELASQFMIHCSVAIYAGLLLVSPYLIYLLYGFIAPALYEQERRYATRVVGGAYLLFIGGVLLNYFLIFPLTFRFLGMYQVDASVSNLISLQSYIDTLMLLSLMMGILFEIPVLSWLLAKVGVLHASWMQQYRRHALVVILITAAIITPTSDVFTLAVVTCPIYLLYEASIWIVRRTKHKPMV